jgi:hypothetical protein
MDREEAERILGSREVPRRKSSRTLKLSRFTEEILDYTGTTFKHSTMQLARDALRALDSVMGDVPIGEISVRDVSTDVRNSTSIPNVTRSLPGCCSLGRALSSVQQS